MESLSPRQANTCSGNKQWYVCTARNFRGCCSSDPCTTGECPDDDNSTGSSTTISVSTVGTTTTEVAKTVSSTTSSTTSHIVSSTEPSSISTVTATDASAVASPSSPSVKPTSHKSIIGGVVGSIAALVLCAILALLYWRCRRHDKRFTLISWRRARPDQSHQGRDTASYAHARFSTSENDSSCLIAPASTASTTNTTGSEFTASRATASSSESSTLTSHSARATPLLPPIILTSSELFGALSPRTGPTPELPDTGFYRPRAELAPYSQSELINVPREERGHRHRLQRISERRGTGSRSRSWDSDPPATAASNPTNSFGDRDSGGGSSSNSRRLATRNTAHRVITADGVVLGANLNPDRYSSELGPAHGRQGKKGGPNAKNQDHVMSFMHYENDLQRGQPRVDGDVGRDAYGDNRGAVAAARSSSAMTVLEEDRGSPIADDDDDSPPAYDEEGVSRRQDVKSPSGTAGMRER